MTCAAIGPVIKICLDGLVSHELAGDLEGRETIGIPDLVELVDEVERARNHVVGSRLAIHDIRAKLRTVLLDGLLLALCIRAGGVLVEKLDGSERLLVLGQLVVCGLGVLHGLLRRRNGSLGIGDSLVLLGLGCIGARERLGSGIDLGLRVDSCLLGIGERLACVVHDLLGGVLRRLRSVGGRLGRILRLLGVVEVGLDVGVGGLVKHLLSRVFLCLGVLYGLLGCGRLALCLIVGRLGVLLVCSIRGMLGSELVRVVLSGLLRRLGRVLLGVLGSGSVTGIGLRLLGIARLAGKGVDVGLRRSAGLGAIGSLLLRLGVGDGSLVVLDGLVCSILCCLGIIGRLLALAGRLVGSILAGLRLVQVRLGRVGSGLLAGKLLVRGIGCGSVAGGLLGVLCLRVCVGSGLLGVGCGRLVVSCGLGGIVRSLLGILRLLWRVVLNVKSGPPRRSPAPASAMPWHQRPPAGPSRPCPGRWPRPSRPGTTAPQESWQRTSERRGLFCCDAIGGSLLGKRWGHAHRRGKHACGYGYRNARAIECTERAPVELLLHVLGCPVCACHDRPSHHPGGSGRW